MSETPGRRLTTQPIGARSSAAGLQPTRLSSDEEETNDRQEHDTLNRFCHSGTKPTGAGCLTGFSKNVENLPEPQQQQQLQQLQQQQQQSPSGDLQNLSL